MPGSNDIFSPHADFLTAFTLHRTVDADDADPTSVDESINLSNSVSAVRNNKIYIIIRQTEGTDGEPEVKLYFSPTDSPVLGGQWFLAEDSQILPTEQLIRFENLYAGEYKLVFSNIAPGEEYQVWSSHSTLNRNS